MVDQSYIDSIALKASEEIMTIVNGPMLLGGETQLKAKIQCIVIEALKQVGGGDGK
jgi:hypothetical protein